MPREETRSDRGLGVPAKFIQNSLSPMVVGTGIKLRGDNGVRTVRWKTRASPLSHR